MKEVDGARGDTGVGLQKGHFLSDMRDTTKTDVIARENRITLNKGLAAK